MSESTAPLASPQATCTVFQGGRCVAAGTYAQVARVLAGPLAPGLSLLVFDDASGAQVDYPWASPPLSPAPAPAPPGPGRPRLGVVAREVTLLPRHWEWLARQRGGASAALRRLVDEARRLHEPQERQRQARERAFRFMSAAAANWPGFEEAARALFAGDGAAFAQRTQAWPPDARVYLTGLTQDAFGAPAAPAPAD